MISEQVADRLMRFCAMLAQAGVEVGYRVRIPHISTTPDGEFLLEWIWPRGRITVYVREEGEEACRILRDGRMEWEELDIVTADDARQVVAWIIVHDRAAETENSRGGTNDSV